MSLRDAYKALGYYVVHKFKRRKGCHGVCVRCGTKRRKTTSGWEWKHPAGVWTSANQPCSRKPERK